MNIYSPSHRPAVLRRQPRTRAVLLGPLDAWTTEVGEVITLHDLRGSWRVLRMTGRVAIVERVRRWTVGDVLRWMGVAP